MAEDKKGFILYADIIGVIKKLIEKDRINKTNDSGELFLHILEYVNDNNPTPLNDTIDLVFEPIKTQLKRDLTKYNNIKGVRSQLGKKGAEVKKQNKAIADLAEAKEAKALNGEANQAVSVNDNVSDNDNVNVSVKTPQNLIDIFFNDLPTSSQLEQISRSIQIPKDKLILRIPEFRKRARIEYPNFPEFCNHFKNWVQKIPTEQQPIKRRQ